MENITQIQFPGGLNRLRKTADFHHTPDTDPERLVWYFKTSTDAAAIVASFPGSKVVEYTRGLCIQHPDRGLLGRDGHPVYPWR